MIQRTFSLIKALFLDDQDHPYGIWFRGLFIKSLFLDDQDTPYWLFYIRHWKKNVTKGTCLAKEQKNSELLLLEWGRHVGYTCCYWWCWRHNCWHCDHWSGTPFWSITLTSTGGGGCLCGSGNETPKIRNSYTNFNFVRR